ncbi:metallophosphatase family protein [Clostridium sp. FP2]|uniref:metallophosphoesterase family protein n=1 Tax=Clostridium sp. FP2 TaxID=2724481 RepID=UPI0013E9739D|nr:YfcE family phosphodiesterase [Clostridium sp. FP2]MBZ9623765.1 metallophosphatase family protein [Clostridium sp. FP2]
MKIAVVADIHSNHIAFEAVLKDINSRDIDRIFFLGDYIFGGYGSNETVDLLMRYQKQNQKHLIISGNIDELITPIEENADWIYPVNKQIYNELGTNRVAFLKSLPSNILIEEEGISMYLCHNPSGIEVFTVVDSLKRENNSPNMKGLAQIASGMGSDVCILGHYHLFMDEEVNGKRFICPSSAGMPFNGDPRAQYIILDIFEGNITTSRQYVEYDRLKLVEYFEKNVYFQKNAIGR